MGLTIYKDAVYTKQEDGTQPSGYRWVPWAAIRGGEGESVYLSWLREKGLIDTTEWEHWDEFLAELQVAYGGIAGASRIVKVGEPGSEVFKVFTPKQTGSDIQEPPAQDATFSGYSVDEIPVIGVTQHEVQDTGQVRPIHTGTYPIADDTVITDINAEDLAAIKNGQIIMGNRGEGSNAGTSAGYAIDHLAGTAVSTASIASQLVSGADGVPDTTFNKTYQEVYANSRTVSTIEQSQTGSLYIGGKCGDDASPATLGAFTNLGATILVAGAASWSGVEADQSTGTLKGYNSQLPAGSGPSRFTKNSIMVARKVGKNKKWSGAWDYFTIPDSGHFEIFHFRIDINNKQAGKIYQYKIKLKNTYKEIPAVFWNWNQWNAVGSKLRSPNYYYDVWTRWDANDKEYLTISVHCKEAAKINVNTALEPYLTFLVVTEDGAEIDWYNNVTPTSPNPPYNAN